MLERQASGFCHYGPMQQRHSACVALVLAALASHPAVMQERRPPSTPGGCTFEGAVGGIAFAFTFTQSQAGIRDDGGGPYVHGADSVVSTLSNAGARVYPYFPPAGEQRRTLLVDLSRPAQPKAQKNFGLIDRPDTNFRVHWKAVDKRISSILEIPIGAQVRSDRVEASVMLEGRQHILRFGDLDTGVCWPAAKLEGPGTTAAVIDRVSATEWHVELPPGSVGRLWDLNGAPTETTELFKLPTRAGGPTTATDRGLYYVDTSIIIRIQKPQINDLRGRPDVEPR
jgi:hypothetical protein